MEGKPDDEQNERGDGGPVNKVKITEIIEVIEGKIGSATKVGKVSGEGMVNGWARNQESNGWLVGVRDSVWLSGCSGCLAAVWPSGGAGAV